MVSPSLEACFLQISAILSLQSAKLKKLAFGNFNITNFQMLKLPENNLCYFNQTNLTLG